MEAELLIGGVRVRCKLGDELTIKVIDGDSETALHAPVSMWLDDSKIADHLRSVLSVMRAGVNQ